MKKLNFYLTLPLLLLFIFLSSCSPENTSNQSSSSIASPPSSSAPSISSSSTKKADNSEVASSSSSSSLSDPAPPYNSYLDILYGETTFFNVTTKDYLDISHIKDALTQDNFPFSIEQFTVLDLDNDGIEEVVLQISLAENECAGFEILHYKEGTVYGYTLVPRGFANLKNDGTFWVSSGASDNGVVRISNFSSTDYSVDEILYCRDNTFYINQEKTSAQNYNIAMDEQLSKTDATWYDFTENNLTIFHQ